MCSCSLPQRVLSACAQKSSRSTGGDASSHSHFPKPEGKDAGDKINESGVIKKKQTKLSMDNLKLKDGRSKSGNVPISHCLHKSLGSKIITGYSTDSVILLVFSP